MQTSFVCTTQSLQWSLSQHKTRDLCLSCHHAVLTRDPPCMCSPHPRRTRASGPLEGATLWMHRQPLPSTAAMTCCSPLCLLLLSFSVCQMAFWCCLWLISQSAAFSQMGPGKGLIPGEHYIRYYIFQMFGLRQAAQAWKFWLSVQATLSREVALVVVYQCWGGDAKPGTHRGPQLGQSETQ